MARSLQRRHRRWQKRERDVTMNYEPTVMARSLQRRRSRWQQKERDVTVN